MKIRTDDNYYLDMVEYQTRQFKLWRFYFHCMLAILLLHAALSVNPFFFVSDVCFLWYAIGQMKEHKASILRHREHNEKYGPESKWRKEWGEIEEL